MSPTGGGVEATPSAGARRSGLPLDLEVVRVKVPAKINLELRVGPLRPDGYHELATVFQALSLFDEVQVTLLPEGRLSLHLEGEGAQTLPTDERNLAMAAALLLRESYGTPELGARIEIAKSIPIAGGMAGGSADAAATLLACAVLWDLDTGPAELTELAARLGADVPFALLGGTALGRGRGDELVPLINRGRCHWVLALSDRGLPTAQVFAALDRLRGAQGAEPALAGTNEALLNAVASGDLEALGAGLVNDLEPAAISLAPELEPVLSTGRRSGALGGVLCGSGATCAFLCASESQAATLAARLARLPGVRAVRRAHGPVPGARLIS